MHRDHLKSFTLILTCLLSAPPTQAEESLRGRVQESDSKPRLSRPPTPVLTSTVERSALQGQNTSGACHTQTKGSSLKGQFDDTSFQLLSKEEMLKGALDLSHWNPWPAKSQLRGYTDSLRSGNFLTAHRYQPPLMHGTVEDLALVERAWRASSQTVESNGRTLNVRVTLALCRPADAAQAAAWEQLMQELRADADNGNMWRQWQDDVTSDIASQAGVLSQLPGGAMVHVRITKTGVDTRVRAGRPDQVRSPREAVAQLVRLMSDNGRLRLPPGSQVDEAHIMITIQAYSPYMGESSGW